MRPENFWILWPAFEYLQAEEEARAMGVAVTPYLSAEDVSEKSFRITEMLEGEDVAVENLTNAALARQAKEARKHGAS